MNELSVDAVVENIETVTDFVNKYLEAYGCPMKAQMQIDIAIDELFGNIAHYAYHPEIGPATVRVEVMEDPLSVIITFIDRGAPFDPLRAGDPDTTLSADERSFGGLGIYTVKKIMDDISYEYRDGKNILRIRKKI
ncbi:MAG: ATP-binding protein [Clostridiales bacterium]|nr:ATP-binding protein [Clostridiales bacterium]